MKKKQLVSLRTYSAIEREAARDRAISNAIAAVFVVAFAYFVVRFLVYSTAAAIPSGVVAALCFVLCVIG